jgi:hypothetical protein
MQKASAGQTLGSHGKKPSGRRGRAAMSDYGFCPGCDAELIPGAAKRIAELEESFAVAREASHFWLADARRRSELLQRERADNARLQRDQHRLEWLVNYLWSLTGDTWPQNATTEAMNYRLFRDGFSDWRYAIDDELRKARENSGE